ncbi:MAG: FlaD/FlaE family flagellar protein [Candidatus Hydrothermarchaeales archaeon]
MDKTDDKGREIIDLGEIRDEDILIFEDGQGTPLNAEETPSFGEDSPPFASEDSPSFAEETPSFGEDSPPFGGESKNNEVPVSDGADSKELEDTIQKVIELENILSKIDSSIMVVKKLNEETYEKASGMEKNILGLMVVYEKITKKMSPFADRELQSEEVINDDAGAFPAPAGENQEFIDETEEVQENESPNTEEIIGEESESDEGSEAFRAVVEGDQGSPGEIDGVQENESQNTMEIMGEGGSNGALLKELDNTLPSAMMLLKWLDFLLQLVGKAGLAETLEFYESLSWISPNVREKMIKFTSGMSTESASESGTEEFRIEDHAISLFFISKIRGVEVSPNIYPSSSAGLKALGLLDE